MGEDVEKSNPQNTASRYVKWYHHCGKQSGSFSKCETRSQLPYDPAVPLRYIHKKNENIYPDKNLYTALIHNSQKVQIT